jgi:transposase
MQQIEIRVLLRHYWKQGFNTTGAARKMGEVKGDDVVLDRTARIWFKKFDDGDTDLRDKSRSGRPTAVDSEEIREAIEANSSTSTRRLSAELDVPQTSVVRHLHALGKVNRCCREVLHEWTEIQARNHVTTCRKLLENPRDDRFIRRIAICDEQGIYFNNPDKQNQWLDPGQVAKPVAKRDRFSRKALLCVWWNFEGPIYFELVPNGRTIDASLYCAQLDQMYAELSRKYPALVNRKRVVLQQDNPKPHTANTSCTAN